MARMIGYVKTKTRFVEPTTQELSTSITGGAPNSEMAIAKALDQRLAESHRESKADLPDVTCGEQFKKNLVRKSGPTG